MFFPIASEGSKAYVVNINGFATEEEAEGFLTCLCEKFPHYSAVGTLSSKDYLSAHKELRRMMEEE